MPWFRYAESVIEFGNVQVSVFDGSRTLSDGGVAMYLTGRWAHCLVNHVAQLQYLEMNF